MEWWAGALVITQLFHLTIPWGGGYIVMHHSFLPTYHPNLEEALLLPTNLGGGGLELWAGDMTVLLPSQVGRRSGRLMPIDIWGRHWWAGEGAFLTPALSYQSNYYWERHAFPPHLERSSHAHAYLPRLETEDMPGCCWGGCVTPGWWRWGFKTGAGGNRQGPVNSAAACLLLPATLLLRHAWGGGNTYLQQQQPYDFATTMWPGGGWDVLQQTPCRMAG